MSGFSGNIESSGHAQIRVYYSLIINMFKKIFYHLILIGCLFLPLVAFAQINEYEVITDQFLKLRSTPSTSGVILDTLIAGQTVSGLDSIDQPEKKMLWLRCRTKEGKTGFAAIRSGTEIYLRKKNAYKDYFICSYSMLGHEMVSAAFRKTAEK